jgi:acylphosphatase
MKQTRVTICFKGRVQGVWFRGFTKQQADQHQVYGWVKNNRNGTVEALFEGEEPAVKGLLAICQDGPPAARVEETIIAWQPATGEFDSFDILY